MLEVHERVEVQPVEVAIAFDRAGLHELVDQLVAEAFDVHGVAAGEVSHALFDFAGHSGFGQRM